MHLLLLAFLVGIPCLQAHEDLDDVFLAKPDSLSYIKTQVDISAECIGLHIACSSAAKSRTEREQCEHQLARCQNISTADCARKCFLPMFRCRYHGIGDWKALVECGESFIKCAAGGCLKTLKVSPGGSDTAHVHDAAANVDISSDCRTLGIACSMAAKSYIEREKCQQQLMRCYKVQPKICAKICVLPMLRCRLQAMGNWKVVMRCGESFIKCASGGCMPPQASPADTALVSDAAANVDISSECRTLGIVCSMAAKSYIEREKCQQQLMRCYKVQPKICAEICILPMLRCRLQALGNWKVVMRCGESFIKCASGGCMPPQVRTVASTGDIPPPPKCDNKYGYCNAWAGKGWCHGKYMKWMILNCCKACSDISRRTTAPPPTTTPTTTESKCIDDNPNCPAWAAQGECEKNPSWMKVHCRKSCHVC